MHLVCHNTHIQLLTWKVPTYLTQVAPIFILQWYSTVFQHPLVWAEIFTTITAIVSITPTTVNQSLETKMKFHHSKLMTLSLYGKTLKETHTYDARKMLTHCWLHKIRNWPVIRWLVESRVWSHTSPHRICGGQCGTWTCLLRVLCFFSTTFIPRMPYLHLWRYSPFCALASLRRCYHSFLSSAYLFQHLIPRIYDVSFWMMSSHLVLSFSTIQVLWNFPLRIYFGILPSFILIWPTHPSFPILILSTIFRSL